MGEKKHRVLIVHNYYKIPGGEDTVVRNELEMLQNAGHFVMLYTRTNQEMNKMGLKQKLLLPFTTIFSRRTYRDIKKMIRDNHIDIVHVHNTLNLISPSVYYAALHCKVPVVQTIHNFRMICPAATCYRNGHICEDCIEKNLLCSIRHNCYRNSKLQTIACVSLLKIHRMTGIYKKIYYICLTEFNKQMLLKQKQINEKQIFIKPNTVLNDVTYDPQCKRKEQYVFAGRLDELKGIKILLEAWKKMGENAPDLILCGTGPLEEWVHHYIQENKLTHIIQKGFIPQQNVKAILAESKGMILPTQWYEGFPMSIVEAFSVGTPVIGSSLGNVGSIIVSGVNGETFSHENADELAECVMHMDIPSDSVYRDFLNKYEKSENLQKLCEIYDQVSKGLEKKK